jgi:hypothetical protein
LSYQPGALGSGFWYPGLAIASATRFFPDIQLLTFDFQLPIPARYFFSANRPSTTEYYCVVVTSAREWTMFSRGSVSGHPTKDVHPELVEGFFSYSPLPAGQSEAISLHSPPLLGRKSSSGKSRVSISSKLIEIKGLQLLYFGHLRKTGGRGSYRLVHTAQRSGGVGLYVLPRFLHSMADVRAARTKENVGHSGRNDGGDGEETEERAGRARPLH